MTLDWDHRSFKVDVDLTVATTTTATTVADPIGCSTSAWLAIDTATSRTDRYQLEEESCDVLRCTAAGDILLDGAPTRHDWRTERLRVDTDRETISLGPASVDGVSVTFELSAPPCEDDRDCECARLIRFVGSVQSELALGRICD